MPVPSALLTGTSDCSGEIFDLVRRAVDDDQPDAQRAEHRQVEHDVGEIVVGDDGAVEGDDERLFPEAGNVGQDAAQIGNFHGKSETQRLSEKSVRVTPKDILPSGEKARVYFPLEISVVIYGMARGQPNRICHAFRYARTSHTLK